MEGFFNGIIDTLKGKADAVLFAVVAFVIGLIAIKIIMSITRRLLLRSRMENVAGKFLATAIKFVLLLVLVYIVLGILGVPSTLFVALTSVSGVAISLSLQGVLSNLASGVIQLGAKRFKEGDYISIGGVEGTVMEVDFISIKLLTVDQKIVYVPNSKSTAETLVNFSANTTRRVDVEVSVAYGTDVELVKSLIGNILTEDERILDDKPKMVRLLRMGASSIDFVVRCHVMTGDYWDVYFDIVEHVYAILNANNIEIPYNKLDVYVKQ